MAVYLGQTKISSSGLLESEVHQQKTVSPTTSTQVVTPDSGYNSLSQVTVNGVTAAIDSNIQSGNIKSGVQILGVTGDYDPTPDLDTLNVTPSTSAQTLTPSGNLDGWDEVNVAAVDHTIDPNIVAGNIKENVTILGVTGSLSPGGGGTINPPPTLTVDYLWFQAQEAGSTLGFYTFVGTTLDVQFEISTDGTNWTTWTYTDLTNYKREFATITFQNAGDYVYIRGNNSRLTNFTQNNIYLKPRFIMTGKIKAGGSIMTLLDKTDTLRTLADVGSGICCLFYGCASLITPPKLPATTLGQYCYQYMFYGCGNLISAPTLPATTLVSGCYQYMFYGCVGLKTVPNNLLPATTLAQYCYRYMFYGCTNLTIMPDLPATTLANNCYHYMFYGCLSLKVVKSLPATATTATYCYSYMFYMCEGLETVTKIALSPSSSYVMSYMFYGCTNLHYIKVSSTSWNTSSTNNWVTNVPSSSTQYTLEFHKPSGTTIASGATGIPSGWTTVNE